MKAKKNKHGLGILIMLFVVVFIGAYVYSSYTNVKNNETDVRVPGLNSKNEPEASKIYNRIMSYDLEKVYPQTVEDVMRLYNDTVYMLYGDMIADLDIMKAVLDQQRKLCSEELINGLSLDEQFINLQAMLSILKDQGSICLGTETKTVRYDPDDKNCCIISVTNNFTGGNTIYRNYILYKNELNNHWEVYSWEITDENFNARVIE